MGTAVMRAATSSRPSIPEQVWPEALVFIALVALMVAEVRDSASLIPQLLKQSRSVIAYHDACRCAATIQ
ncbi:hypothetical protein V1279_003555 [Bradyrhizobium sp. AZCC 1610]|uniref:hypothetical protein n=1 Tax=Bradyrhizobium sp. AZCC 1610 TaxID=3117020 RepID=UPI002FEF45CF